MKEVEYKAQNDMDGMSEVDFPMNEVEFNAKEFEHKIFD